MSLQDERQDQRRRKGEGSTGGSDTSATDRPAARKKRGPPGEVGNALRSAYQRMIDEDIPPEMLDLLGKLG